MQILQRLHAVMVINLLVDNVVVSMVPSSFVVQSLGFGDKRYVNYKDAALL